MTRKRHRAAKAKPVKSAEEVYAALVRSRGLVSAFDRTLARQITNLLVEGRVLEAVKGLEHLPPVVRVERITDAHGDHSAKEHVLALIANAVAADQTELAQRAERGEKLTEVEQLRLRLIEAEAAAIAADDAADEVERAERGERGEAEQIARLTAENRELRRLLAGAGAEPTSGTGADPTSGTARVITPSIGDKQGVVTVTAEHDTPDDADGELVAS